MSKKLARIIIMKLFAISSLTFAQDQTIPLVQYPAGSASIEPAPNVIISVDDSGSMGNDGIKSLKNALKETFSEANIPDKRLRIAWQSMNGCKNLPDSKCQNGLKILDKTHRKSFLDWVDTLNANGGTPSHKMIRNAGDYLSRSKESFNSKPEDWPWSEIPGTKVGDVLACRKSFHIFMTDGSWNSGASSTSSHIDADRDLQAYKTIEGNLDGAERILPDGTKYNPDDPNLKIYKDDWGGSYSYSITTCARRDWWGYCTGYKTETIEDSINTLSDLAFHYWAKDLQPGIPNSVKPIIKVESDETITKNGKSVTFTPYWNPKNNPATWQSLTTYTIGFGTATNWNKNKNSSEQLLAWSNDTYSGSYHDLALGLISWPSPLCGIDNRNILQTDIKGTIACDGPTLYGAHNEIGNRRTELWHMAINSRGKFIPAKTSEDLKRAFSDIVSNIIEDTSQPITGFSSSSGSVSTQGTTAYVSTYDARGWKGGIYSQQVAQGSAALSANSAWGTRSNGEPQTTGDKLDNLSNDQIKNRLILTSNNSGKGVNFEKSSLSTSDKNSLLIRRTASATPGITEDDFLQNTIDFLRGDRKLEGKNAGNIPFRKRDSRQGDIVNSATWYVGAPNQGYGYQGYANFSKTHASRLPMLYVGGNDGMLHGFSAIDGSEKIAYIPRGVIKNLHLLTTPEYVHRYFVDGSAFTGDIDTDTSENSDEWKTVLVGALGAGGKGYFALDVTSPGSSSSTGVASNFDKKNAETLVILDKTETNDPDIGHIFAEPVTYEYNAQITTQIAKLNNGRWAAVMGNGYNSINQRPVLLIQYLDGDKSLLKIIASTSATNSSLNGLGAPRLVDINDDGMPDVVYAGDLKGNMWKFNISSTNSTNWGVAFNGEPLFTAEYKQGERSLRQPITTAPLVRANRSAGGLMIAFGTGRHLTEGDRTDTSIQSFYSVQDNTRYVIADSGADKGKVTIPANSTASPISSGRDDLVERTFNSTPINGSGNSSNQTFWNMGDQTELTYSGAQAKRGWFLDLPEDGERVIRHPRFYVAGSNIIEILSDVPASGGNTEGETCEPTSTPAKAWRTLLGIEFGNQPKQQLLDANGDGLYNTLDENTNRVTAPPIELALRGKGEQIRIGSGGSTTKIDELSRPTSTVNWRQMR